MMDDIRPVAWIEQPSRWLGQPMAHMDADLDEEVKKRCEPLYEQSAIDALQAEVEVLRELCACAYQMAGVHDAPLVWMDALSNAANGCKFDTCGLLPYMQEQVCDAESQVKKLTQANIAYSQQVAELIGRAGNAEAESEKLREKMYDIAPNFNIEMDRWE